MLSSAQSAVLRGHAWQGMPDEVALIMFGISDLNHEIPHENYIKYALYSVNLYN